MDKLVEGVLAGRTREIARLITLVESREPEAQALLQALHPYGGQALSIGVTGPPGAGKSTFVDRLVGAIRQSGLRVGIVAVDPASPFSGGAILGDRLRMAAHQGDSGVFIRSMSARGQLGGLAAATEAAMLVFDAAGFEVVLIETVGVGQSEIEVAELADTTVLVQPPGLGDGVQAVKAGIMEVPAIFVINKADGPGAQQAASDIRQMLELQVPPPGAWLPPVILACSLQEEGSGAEAVWEAIQAHGAWLKASGGLEEERRRRMKKRLYEAAGRLIVEALEAQAPAAWVEELVDGVIRRKVPPGSAAAALARAFCPAIEKGL